VKEMLVMLAESFPEEIAALQNTYQGKNWEALRAIAHKLKGGASYCGTLRLKSACAELENYIESGLTARIAELYDRLLAEISAVKNLIDRGEFVS
jgi:FOG: HPt domain